MNNIPIISSNATSRVPEHRSRVPAHIIVNRAQRSIRDNNLGGNISNRNNTWNSRFNRMSHRRGMQKNNNFLRWDSNGYLVKLFHQTESNAIKIFIVEFIKIRQYELGDELFNINRNTSKWLLCEILARFTNSTNICTKSPCLTNPTLKAAIPYKHDPLKPRYKFTNKMIEDYQQYMMRYNANLLRKRKLNKKNNKNSNFGESAKLNSSQVTMNDIVNVLIHFGILYLSQKLNDH